MVADSREIEYAIVGWASIPLCSLCVVVFLVQLIAPKPRLTIDGYGVTWTARSDQTIPWSAITDVGIIKVSRGAGFLALNLENPSQFPPRRPSRRTAPSLIKRWYGADVDIPLGLLNTSARTVMAAVDQYWPPR